MTKAAMIKHLVRIYPHTTARYWSKESAAVVRLNWQLAIGAISL